jgi:hypothetical protein
VPGQPQADHGQAQGGLSLSLQIAANEAGPTRPAR